MTVKSNHVTIKGIKDGLVFLFDDQCDFSELLNELRYKLEHSHQNILTGPIVHVDVKMGMRNISEEQKTLILETLKQKGNLLIRSVETPGIVEDEQGGPAIKTLCGMVRSGQILKHEGNLLFMGDVNPGGQIICTGDVIVIGAIRGMVHAGSGGNEKAVIAASFLAPTQLRIAEVISRPPDEWENRETSMEFAFLQEGSMQIDKINHVGKIRPDFNVFKGV
ncbi:septum site-determining protein MinC [Paenibacillus physcomitrellae]|uniref:Probable septum site-determining protein MinC n=1 Tax=Paenibacillus physcomitrellae TaxID=1619311 RepID=A0ABQ1G4M0_9BACL|nr:septum site-determining protein MinC [Paenibacillus physcomitrellae]GGA36580.1 septum site-determining protein MinC [Paenibacillus physcomitrellae]